MKEVVMVYRGYEQGLCDIMCVLNFTVDVANCLFDFLYKLDFQILIYYISIDVGFHKLMYHSFKSPVSRAALLLLDPTFSM